MFSVCVSLGKQSSAHFFFFYPSFPGDGRKKIFQKKKQESANAKKHECVCICVLFFFGGGDLCESCQRQSDGGTGPSLEVKLNNNKSTKL